MADSIKKLQETGSSHPPMSVQDVTTDEVEEAMRQLRIRPRKVLESLGHLRIEKSRIKPLEDKAPKSGGNADVEASILVPAQPSHSLGSEDTEYVAVKKLRFDTDTEDDRVLAPFAHEINILNDLSHPSVAKIVGFVEDVENGIAWMVFSWEKNGNLREFVRSADWELPERVSLIGDVILGLNHLHGRTPPICHGDLKSLNILVNSQNLAIITDFGSARRMDSATAAAVGRISSATTEFQHRNATTTFTVESLKAEIAASGDFITMTGPAWTIRWAAPELLEGELPDLASDIWALGWIFWEAITGNFPFDEENDVAIILRITRGDLPAVRDTAQLVELKALCSLMEQCWRLNANERPSAMRCQQVISFMTSAIPASSKVSGSATTRSSGLLYALGSIQLRNGKMSEAEEYFRESLVVANSVGDRDGRARALDGLGRVYYRRSEYSRAEESYILARDTYSQLENQAGFANSIKSLGDVYHMRDEYSKAEESYIQARDIHFQIGDQLGFANSVKGLGEVYRMRDEYSKAEECYIQARDTYSEIGHQQGFANSVSALGDVYHMRGEYSQAEESYIQARDTYSQIGDQLGFANSVRGLGDVYYIRGEHSKAEESYIQARDTYSKIGDQASFSNSVKCLGDVYLMQSEYSKAEESFIQARNTFSRIGDQLGVANSVNSLGEMYRMQDEYFKAEESYIQARDIYSQIGSLLGVANSVQGLGHVYTASGQYSQAEKSYLDAEAVYSQIGDMGSSANNLWYLGWLRRHQAQYDEAERLVCEASILYGKIGLETDVAECDEFLTELKQLMAA